MPRRPTDSIRPIDSIASTEPIDPIDSVDSDRPGGGRGGDVIFYEKVEIVL